MLDDLLDGSISFTDAEKKSVQLKSQEALTEAFSKINGFSWEEAVKEVPEYADINMLNKYKVSKGKAPPQEFKVLYVHFENTVQEYFLLSVSAPHLFMLFRYSVREV